MLSIIKGNFGYWYFQIFESTTLLAFLGGYMSYHSNGSNLWICWILLLYSYFSTNGYMLYLQKVWIERECRLEKLEVLLHDVMFSLNDKNYDLYRKDMISKIQ